MKKYLIDANIIIKTWEENEKFLNKLLLENKVIILKEVLDELSVKERKKYRGKDVLSERFCKLLSYIIVVDEEEISGFYMIFDYEANGKFEKSNLSKNDLLQLYACYINYNFNLVTEDKELFEISRYILEEKRVYSLEKFIGEVNNI